MTDTLTVLNLGTGGDSMDESRVLQGDNVTLGNRPRVVIGGDAGFNGNVNDLVQPVKADPGANPVSLPAVAVAIVNDASSSGYVDGELRGLSMTNDGRLRVSTMPSRLGISFITDSEKGMWGGLQSDVTPNNSPW